MPSPIQKLRALLIGIDTYEKVPPLSGASNDAHRMCTFLRLDLCVPGSQIMMLTNQRATRSNILDALKTLRKDTRIGLFDPILIYYAGHGCEVKSPSAVSGKDQEKTQCLVPWDVGKRDTNGKAIPPIPDYTIAALLDELAAEKGNNITVIFDCCHSASSTRGIHWISRTLPDLEYKISSLTNKMPLQADSASRQIALDDCQERSFDPEDLPPLTSDTDSDIHERHMRVMSRGKWMVIIALRLLFSKFRSAAVEVRAGKNADSQANIWGQYIKQAIVEHLRPGRSHVLLAACGHTERAYENKKSKRGIFTHALLQNLRSHQVEELTYKALFEDFPTLVQNPVCEGANAGRLFLKAPVLGQHCASISMKQLDNGCFIMKAGDAQGVMPGSVYSISGDGCYSRLPQAGHWSKPSARLTHKAFSPCPSTESNPNPLQSCCELGPDIDIPNRPRAKLVARGQHCPLKVLLSNKPELKQKMLEQPDRNQAQGIILVDSHDDPGINIVLDVDLKGQITFELPGCLFGLPGLPGVLPYTCRPDPSRIRAVLFSMAQWQWHLTREPHIKFKSQNKLAELTLFQLHENGPLKIPVKDRTVNVASSAHKRYAIKLRSLCNQRLYAYLFYFSTASQSIRPLYLRVYGSGHVDPPLPAHGELTIGYGNNDMISGPLSLQMPDVGYFRLFLTFSPTDFDSMTQPSPFVPSRLVYTGDRLPCGGEYLDGVEIKKLSLTTNNSEMPGNMHWAPTHPDRAHAISAPVLKETSALDQRIEKLAIAESSRVHLSDTEARRLMAEKGICLRASKWDVVSLKVIIS